MTKRTTERVGKAEPRTSGNRARHWPRRAGRLILVGAALVLMVFGLQPVERPTLSAREGIAIGAARSWGYQLQNVQLQTIADGFDVLVVDYSRDGSGARVFGPAEVDRLRLRADGSKRIVLAYMSLGEAENYRFYWQRRWRPGQPSWLGPENPEWQGNFQVRYWEQGWRDIIMQPQVSLFGRVIEALQPGHRPYLDHIIEAGFDGVYLDRVDAFDHWAAENKNAQTQMVSLVSSISAYGKHRRPGFLIVPQNGEELLRFPDYRRVIDGIAKEDLVYGIKGDGQPNRVEEVRRGIDDLNRAKAEGRPVFVVEYLVDPLQRADVQRQLAARGFIVQFAQRDLRLIPE